MNIIFIIAATCFISWSISVVVSLLFTSDEYDSISVFGILTILAGITAALSAGLMPKDLRIEDSALQEPRIQAILPLMTQPYTSPEWKAYWAVQTLDNLEQIK